MFIELLKKKDFEEFARIFQGSIFKLKKEDGKVILTLYCCDLDDNSISPLPEFTLTDFMLYLNQRYAIHQSYAIDDWRTFLDKKMKLLGIENYGEKLKEFSPLEYKRWVEYKKLNMKYSTENEPSYVEKLKPKHFIKLAKKLGNFIEQISCEYIPYEKCWKVNFVGEGYNKILYFYDFEIKQEQTKNENINYVPLLNNSNIKREYFNMMSKLFDDYQEKLQSNNTQIN